MGLAERDYMKRTPEELEKAYGGTTRAAGGAPNGLALVLIVALFVAGIAGPQLAAWLGIGLPFP
jgi:hypothetical protein